MAAAIVDGERVLVTRRRDNGKWEPPGGTLEPTETIVDGLVREVREEVGLEIVPGRLTGVYKNMTQGIVALVFRCEHNGEIVQTSEEVSEIFWMTRTQVQENLDEAYACRLIDAMDPGPVSIRAHDGTVLL